MLKRRQLLAGGIALGGATLSFPSLLTARTAGTKRLLFILQRGAADGLATLAPTGDPAFLQQRGELGEQAEAGFALDPFFTLHPGMKTVASLYRQRQAVMVHAVASAYRERSHFDGQNLLESGALRPQTMREGWLNRLAALLQGDATRALAIAASIPLALRGPEPVSNYVPSRLPQASDALMDRVSRMYRADAQLAGLWEEALETRDLVGDGNASAKRDAKAIGELAGKLMRGPNGANIAMLESEGWDSHSSQRGLLKEAFSNLDATLAAYRAAIGDDWADTLVVIATEFGRTVKANGTKGTDHGTASVVTLLGGGVNGGRIVADWPGLRTADLYEGRDLRPTRSLETVLAGSIAEHFALDPGRALSTLFPGRNAAPLAGLLRA